MSNAVMIFPEALPDNCPPELVRAVGEMAQTMRGMADMLRTTNERISELEHEVRLLTKVTPAQASQLNRAIKERAAELCGIYRAVGCESGVTAAIRKAVKLSTGVGTFRDLPRCEYEIALEQISGWEDYKKIRELRAKAVRA